MNGGDQKFLDLYDGSGIKTVNVKRVIKQILNKRAKKDADTNGNIKALAKKNKKSVTGMKRLKKGTKFLSFLKGQFLQILTLFSKNFASFKSKI